VSIYPGKSVDITGLRRGGAAYLGTRAIKRHRRLAASLLSTVCLELSGEEGSHRAASKCLGFGGRVSQWEGSEFAASRVELG
jgi:hypothetical protein